MSKLQFVFASLVHYGRTNLAVAFGVMAATAVLTGALLVGDSMQGSLRDLTLDRLGRIDQAVVSQTFFDAQLCDKTEGSSDFQKYFDAAVPAIVLDASFENTALDPPRRANRVTLIGCDERISALGPGGPAEPIASGQIVINRELAKDLKLEDEGADIMLRLPRITSIPADSPLGRKDETIESSRVKVAEIIPSEGLGRFNMRPGQAVPTVAFVPLAWLQDRLEQAGKVNAIFVTGLDPSQAAPLEADAVLPAVLAPQPADLGLSIAETKLGYFNVTSRQMMLSVPVESELLRTIGDRTVQPALTYLANAVAVGDREVPYSTVAAVDFSDSPPLGPFADPDGKSLAPLGDGEICLNSWAAQDLKAKVGDVVRVRYFRPESTDGAIEETEVELKLAAIAQLAGAAADPGFTPEVEGVTDQLSINDWDPPFPFDARAIRDQDETYWDEHRATPKAFVSLATGRKLWGSRFGETTSLRVVPKEGESLEQFTSSLSLKPEVFGFRFQPLKRQGLAASKGATPFDVLFLAFSFFVIIAAVMLVLLLFRLGIEQRAESIGLLQAVGLNRRTIAGLLAMEGLVVAALAAAAGIGLGVGYAALMLLGLRTLWLAAVVTPFLILHVDASSLLVGYACGVALCFAAILWALWRSRQTSIARLLGGQFDDEAIGFKKPWAWTRWLAPAMILVAIAVAVTTRGLREEVRAGAFFGAGALVLTAGLLAIRRRLRAQATGPAVAPGRGNLLRLTLRNAARNPGRSTLSIGLIASTCFLIVAISAFHFDPALQKPRIDSGNGGFALVAETDQPIYYDVNSDDGRFDLGFSDDDSDLLAQTTTYGLRVQAGDHATCLNLYQPRQPRIFGLPKALIERGGFSWASSAAKTPEEKANPWLLLGKPAEADTDGTPCLPVVLDMNTAVYALHLTSGVGQTYDVTDDQGRTVRLRVVGLLNNSILQGNLLITEEALLKHFPQVTGRRFFLIESDDDRTDAVEAAWNRTLGDFGLKVETSGARLSAFLAIQNTYLLTFQSVGGLGLLLGTFGLAAVQLRNVLERRRELALLRAVGFRRSTLGLTVLLENALLLGAGLVCGVVAAAVALLPHLMAGHAAVPVQSLALMLLTIFVVGLLASLFAVRATLRAPLVAALRGQ